MEPANCSTVKEPVATAMVFAPMACRSDVVRRVADDPDALGRELDAEFFLRAGQRERPEFIADMAVVRVGAELEIIPNAEMRKLQPRASR